MTAVNHGTRRPARPLALAGLGVAVLFTAAELASTAARLTGSALAGVAVLAVIVAACSLTHRYRELMRRPPALTRPAPQPTRPRELTETLT